MSITISRVLHNVSEMKTKSWPTNKKSCPIQTISIQSQHVSNQTKHWLQLVSIGFRWKRFFRIRGKFSQWISIIHRLRISFEQLHILHVCQWPIDWLVGYFLSSLKTDQKMTWCWVDVGLAIEKIPHSMSDSML